MLHALWLLSGNLPGFLAGLPGYFASCMHAKGAPHSPLAGGPGGVVPAVSPAVQEAITAGVRALATCAPADAAEFRRVLLALVLDVGTLAGSQPAALGR